MFYLVTKTTSYRSSQVEVQEFETSKEAIAEARKHPRTVVAVFEGKRLQFKKDKVRVIREDIVGFEDFESNEA